jgi:acetylornithine deacetylase/succinyl-diaminopimelate desuccinylase-like protein
MVFVPSIAGLSHAKEENTSDDDLATGIEVFGALASNVLQRSQ